MNSVLGSSMGWQWHAEDGAALKTLVGFNVSHVGMGRNWGTERKGKEGR